MPQVDEAITGWEYDILVNKRKQTMVNGDVVYKNVFIKMRGCLQPLKMSEIEVKPEHERDWEWFYRDYIRTYLEKEACEFKIDIGEEYSFAKLHC